MFTDAPSTSRVALWRSLRLLGLVLALLPLTTACQTFDKNVRRSLTDIDPQKVDRSQIAFDSEAMIVELRCRDDSSTCQELAEKIRYEVNAALVRVDSKRAQQARYPGRMRVQVRVTQYWNPMNLMVFPMIYGIPVDRQSADVTVDIEYNGKIVGGTGGAGCFSSLFILRGPDGSSGCAIGEGIAEALNAALDRIQELKEKGL